MIEIKKKAVILRITGVLKKSVLVSGFMIDRCDVAGGGESGVVARVAATASVMRMRVSKARPGARVN